MRLALECTVHGRTWRVSSTIASIICATAALGA